MILPFATNDSNFDLYFRLLSSFAAFPLKAVVLAHREFFTFLFDHSATLRHLTVEAGDVISDGEIQLALEAFCAAQGVVLSFAGGATATDEITQEVEDVAPENAEEWLERIFHEVGLQEEEESFTFMIEMKE